MHNSKTPKLSVFRDMSRKRGNSSFITSRQRACVVWFLRSRLKLYWFPLWIWCAAKPRGCYWRYVIEIEFSYAYKPRKITNSTFTYYCFIAVTRHLTTMLYRHDICFHWDMTNEDKYQNFHFVREFHGAATKSQMIAPRWNSSIGIRISCFFIPSTLPCSAQTPHADDFHAYWFKRGRGGKNEMSFGSRKWQRLDSILDGNKEENVVQSDGGQSSTIAQIRRPATGQRCIEKRYNSFKASKFEITLKRTSDRKSQLRTLVTSIVTCHAVYSAFCVEFYLFCSSMFGTT